MEREFERKEQVMRELGERDRELGWLLLLLRQS
jgi:hypothetical protein